jgi:phospholipid-binding lipoprotein MlaA
LARWLAVAALGTILAGCGTLSATVRADSRAIAPPAVEALTASQPDPVPAAEPVVAGVDAPVVDAAEPPAADASAPAVTDGAESSIAAAGADALEPMPPAVVVEAPQDTWMAQPRDNDVAEDEYDPWEPFNERMFEFNRRLDRYILKPVAKAYNFITPDELQIMISNGFDNISFPPRFVNSVLQGKLKGAAREIGRFLINSTLGVGGLFDPAKDVFGLVKSREDFGQTLGFYGVGPGPFLIMPLMPPLTVRDGIGKFVDSAMDPLAYYLPLFWDRLGMKIGDTINERSLNLDLFQGFEESVIDLYSAVRHGYLQRREKMIRE